MFEVARVFLIELIPYIPKVIALYVLFDFIGMLIPGVGKSWRD